MLQFAFITPLIAAFFTILIGYITYFYLAKKNKPIIISVDGNIGSGKSTLLNILKVELQDNKNIVFLQEPVSEWLNISDGKTNILNEFYNDKNRWSYTFQNLAFITRIKLLSDAVYKNTTNIFQKRKVIITERSTETDKHIFAKMLYDDKNITELEYKIYNYWYEHLVKNFIINNIIYLRTTPLDAYNRIKKRSRDEESEIPIDYIQNVHNYHDNWLVGSNNNCNICYLDGKDDFINNEKHKRKIVKSITVFINSLESRFYLPA